MMLTIRSRASLIQLPMDPVASMTKQISTMSYSKVTPPLASRVGGSLRSKIPGEFSTSASQSIVCSIPCQERQRPSTDQETPSSLQFTSIPDKIQISPNMLFLKKKRKQHLVVETKERYNDVDHLYIIFFGCARGHILNVASKLYTPKLFICQHPVEKRQFYYVR